MDLQIFLAMSCYYSLSHEQPRLYASIATPNYWVLAISTTPGSSTKQSRRTFRPKQLYCRSLEYSDTWLSTSSKNYSSSQNQLSLSMVKRFTKMVMRLKASILYSRVLLKSVCHLEWQRLHIWQLRNRWLIWGLNWKFLRRRTYNRIGASKQ